MESFPAQELAGGKNIQGEVKAMTIYVLVASGQYTETIDGTPMTANRVELIQAFTDYQTALDLLKSGIPDVKDPEGWGPRGIDIQTVELAMEEKHD